MGRPRVLLADDHALVLEGLKELLEPEFEVVASITDSRSLLATAARLKPEVIVVEINMPGLSAQATGLELKRLLPLTKLIVLTVEEGPAVAREAIHSWASGYLLKKSAASELSRAMRDSLRGESYVTPQIAQQLQGQFIRNPKQEHRKELTSRQREVLRLLVQGKTLRETASALNVTPRTVAFHKYRIMEDFDLRNNSELIVFAMRERII